MSTRTYPVNFTALQLTWEGPAGNFFMIQSAAAALTVETLGNTSAPKLFQGVGAGLKFRARSPQDAWRTLKLTSSVPQSVVIIISDEGEVDFASLVNIAGDVTIAERAARTISTPARIAVGAAQALLIAANTARLRVTITNPSTNDDSINVGASGEVSAVRGEEVQPGTSKEFRGEYALYGFAVSGTQSIQVTEES